MVREYAIQLCSIKIMKSGFWLSSLSKENLNEKENERHG
jgi:hypothetical protein